jgi:RNA-binding protein
LGIATRIGLPSATIAAALGVMYELSLTGAQKARLRGLGQTLGDHAKVGRAGVTPAFLAELQNLLRAHELVKLRFLGVDREERARMRDAIADEGRCVCVGAVGATALFYRPNPDPKRRRIALPDAADRSGE